MSEIETIYQKLLGCHRYSFLCCWLLESVCEGDAIKKELREKVWQKYDKHCAYCGKILDYKDMQVDHLTPKNKAHYYNSKRMKEYLKAKGDNINSFKNLMPSCRRCNHYKRAYTLEQFRALMTTLHDRVDKQYITKVAIDYGIVTIEPFSGVFYFEKRENFTAWKEMPRKS